MIAGDPTWAGLGRGLLVLVLIWWAWAAYAWLTDMLSGRQDRVRLVMFAAMAAMFVASLAIPGAFGDEGLLFGCAYVVVRLAHILLFGYAANGTPVGQAVRSILPSVAVAGGLVVAASFFDGAAQAGLFAAAVVIDYVGGGRGVDHWLLRPGHFAERHGLIVMIALGESIVSTGIGASRTALGPGEILAAVLGVALAAALWWAYFDAVAALGEHRLRAAAPGREQNAMARDGYSYVHLALIAGIVLIALGSKLTLEHVGEPLETVPAAGLCGGVALYLAGHVAFRARISGVLGRQRLLAAILALAFLPLTGEVSAVVTLAAMTALACALVAYEARRPATDGVAAATPSPRIPAA